MSVQLEQNPETKLRLRWRISSYAGILIFGAAIGYGVAYLTFAWFSQTVTISNLFNVLGWRGLFVGAMIILCLIFVYLTRRASDTRHTALLEAELLAQENATLRSKIVGGLSLDP